MIVVLIDVGLSILSGVLLKIARRNENYTKKIFLIALSVITALLIFIINYKFIPGKLWFLISLTFIVGTIQFYFWSPKSPSTPEAESYKGD